MESSSAPAAAPATTSGTPASTSSDTSTSSAPSEGTSTATSTNQEGAQSNTPAPTPAEIKKYKLKLNVYGKEEEKEYTEEEIVKDMQKGRAASKIREEAARERAQVQQEQQQIAQEREQYRQLITALKDPVTARQILKHVGNPIEQMSQQALQEYVDYQNLTPEQRELQELRSWRSQEEQRQQKAQHEQQQAQFEREVEQHKQQFASTIVGAMQKLGISEQDARSSREVAQRLAFKLQSANQVGYQPTAEELAEELMDDMKEEHRSFYGKLPGEQIFNMWGEDGLKKAQEYATSRIKQVPSVGNPPPPAEGQAPLGIKTLKDFKGPNARQEYFEYVDNLVVPEHQE